MTLVHIIPWKIARSCMGSYTGTWPHRDKRQIKTDRKYELLHNYIIIMWHIRSYHCITVCVCECRYGKCFYTRTDYSTAARRDWVTSVLHENDGVRRPNCPCRTASEGLRRQPSIFLLRVVFPRLTMMFQSVRSVADQQRLAHKRINKLHATASITLRPSSDSYTYDPLGTS
jgi:hypothetical protein